MRRGGSPPCGACRRDSHLDQRWYKCCRACHHRVPEWSRRSQRRCWPSQPTPSSREKIARQTSLRAAVVGPGTDSEYSPKYAVPYGLLKHSCAVRPAAARRYRQGHQLCAARCGGLDRLHCAGHVICLVASDFQLNERNAEHCIDEKQEE